MTLYAGGEKDGAWPEERGSRVTVSLTVGMLQRPVCNLLTLHVEMEGSEKRCNCSISYCNLCRYLS